MRSVFIACLLCLPPIHAAGQTVSADCAELSELLDRLRECLSPRSAEEAIPGLLSAIERSPRCAEAHLRLGECYSATGQEDNARASYERAHALEPGLSAASSHLAIMQDRELLQLAAAGLRAKEWFQARRAIRTLAGHNPEDLPFVFRLVYRSWGSGSTQVFPALMEAYRRGPRPEICGLVECMWLDQCPECEFEILTEKGATLLVLGRKEEAAAVRREVEARLQSPDLLLVEMPNAEFLEACGLPYLKAQPLRQKLPKYTREAAAKKVQGSVLLEGVIERDGRVRDLAVLKPLEQSLDRRSLEVVGKDWRFRPATIGGQPVRQRARMEINYRLK
ncbi:MAG: TonB family protein [Acidobacteriota bacterium]